MHCKYSHPNTDRPGVVFRRTRGTSAVTDETKERERAVSERMIAGARNSACAVSKEADLCIPDLIPSHRRFMIRKDPVEP